MQYKNKKYAITKYLLKVKQWKNQQKQQKVNKNGNNQKIERLKNIAMIKL